MARKNGLNRKEQIQCAKALEDGVPAKTIAKKFKTSVTIVRKFTQAKLDAAAKAAKERLEGQNKAAAQIKKNAKVLKETLKQTTDEENADFT